MLKLVYSLFVLSKMFDMNRAMLQWISGTVLLEQVGTKSVYFLFYLFLIIQARLSRRHLQ